MANMIVGKEYPLSKIFSKDFEFSVPGYQRPYAWTNKEAGELYDDLYDAYSNEEDGTYFLGSIVLVKKSADDPKSEVIDGQQRLSTLTMLLSVIATFLPGKKRETWNKYLIEEGNEFEGIEPKPRVVLREKDQSFFEYYVQKSHLGELYSIPDTELKNESQMLIRDNCAMLRERLESSFSKHGDIFSFGKYIIQNCFLICVSTPNRNAAFRVFAIMNGRGMNLLPTDIIKAQVIGNLPEKKQNEYTDKWEEMEVSLTRQGFNDVIIHTRMIFAKTKAKANILDEFKDSVLSRFSPEELVDNVLEPYSDAYACLTKRNYAAPRHADEINSVLFWLNKVDDADWMPTAIKFFSDRKNDPEYVLWFVNKYERLVAYLYITASDRRKRIDRFRLLLEEMEMNPDHGMTDPLESIELSNSEKKEFIEALDGEIYKMTPGRRNYVILRLNSFLSDGANKYDSDPNILTIEHVLPQTIKRGSEWEKNWPDSEVREKWLNRIANLVPLTRKKNSSAQNDDFKKKRDVYFTGKNGVTTYPLTTQVIQIESWIPEIMEERQKSILKVYSEKWNLEFKSVDTTIEPVETTTVFTLDKRGAKATLDVSNGLFVVKAGSRLSDVISDNFPAGYVKAYNLRNDLVRDGLVVDGVFTRDYEFDSMSLCTSVILGRSASGGEWKDSGEVTPKGTGKKTSYEGVFDIENEATYMSLPTGKLAYALIERLLTTGCLTDDEIEKLKDRRYSKSLFDKTDYPVLADSSDAHMGNGRHKRYRVKPVKRNGVDIYISTQWYEGNRAELIAWYKQHLETATD